VLIFWFFDLSHINFSVLQILIMFQLHFCHLFFSWYNYYLLITIQYFKWKKCHPYLIRKLRIILNNPDSNSSPTKSKYLKDTIRLSALSDSLANSFRINFERKIHPKIVIVRMRWWKDPFQPASYQIPTNTNQTSQDVLDSPKIPFLEKIRITIGTLHIITRKWGWLCHQWVLIVGCFTKWEKKSICVERVILKNDK